jgi:DNA invertase Pin-like site-specific DNA recombinase
VPVSVSTTGPGVRSQEPDPRACAKGRGQGSGVRAVWYRGTFTGSTFERPGMSRLEAEIRTRRLRPLVVWRLDRLGRTASETTSLRG